MSVELNLGSVVMANAAVFPDRPAIVHGARTTTYRELADRSHRLAGFLARNGLGNVRERGGLAGHESGQALLAQYLFNGPEYLETMIGAFVGRVAPFNVNYRYVADELRYLFNDARPSAIVYHATFAPVLDEVLRSLDHDVVLLQVADESRNSLLPGAVDYETALAGSMPPTGLEPSPDDLYVLFTGGTTGMPKGVLWRQADVAVAAIGLYDRAAGTEWPSEHARLAALRRNPARVMPCAPYMHGAAQWGALQALGDCNTVVMSPSRSFDPSVVLDTIVRHQVGGISIVGDAFGRPLADELDTNPRELPSLRYIISGGAALQPATKQRLLAHLPNVTIVDTIGSSEAGQQGRHEADRSRAGEAVRFKPDHATAVLSADRGEVLDPGHDGIGWLARRGRVPLGYLGDPAKTAQTFPVIAGERWTVTGDRARVEADGTIELLGRDSVTINSGGEKVFAEEVEAAVKSHPDVVDAVVCGRPSERWGAEVVAIVARVAGSRLDADAVRSHARQHLADYKRPKAVVFVDVVRRSPAGKPDYRWAAEVAADAG